MVYIRRVEAKGFKSLGPNPISLTFEQNLTVITGPNGSGKSNIMDAILFCLGENRPKVLRAERLTSLTYDGGPGVGRPSICKVSVSFDNRDQRVPIDSNIVTVTRELSESGESKYYLNGRRTQKGSLDGLLDAASIGPQGLNFVPQGAVMRFSEMSPDEKRKIIEGMVGIVQFDVKKAEAQRQLQEADLKLQVALARIGEIRKRVYDLEGERADQIRLRQLENELTVLRATIASGRLAALRREVQIAEKECERVRRDLQQEESKAVGLASQLAQAERERSDLMASLMGTGGDTQVEVQFRIAEATSELERLQGGLKDANQESTTTEQELPGLKKVCEQRLQQVSQMKEAIGSLKLKIAEIGKQRKSGGGELRMISKELVALERQASKASIRQARLVARIETRDRELYQLSVKVDALAGRLSLLEERLKAAKEKYQTFDSTLKEFHARLDQLRSLKQGEEQALEAVASSIGQIEDRERKIHELFQSASATLSSAREQILRHESIKSVVEVVAPAELAAAKLVELVREGALQGYIGRIRDLISYPPNLERAVRAAAGPLLDATVVSDVPAAIRILEVAKRFRTSRLWVLPISELGSLPIVEAPRSLGAIGNLSAVLSCPEAVEGAVRFVFGDTVLAQSIRDAYELARQGFKSVTLTGDILEPMGRAIATGRLSRSHELATLLVDEHSVDGLKDVTSALAKLIAERKAVSEALTQRARKLDDEKFQRSLAVERVASEIATLQRFTSKYNRTLRDAASRLELLRRRVENVRRRLKAVGAAKGLIEQKREKDQKALDELRQAPTSAEISSLREKKSIVDKTISELDLSLRERLTEVSKLSAELQHERLPGLKRLKELITEGEKLLREKRLYIKRTSKAAEQLSESLRTLREERERVLQTTKASRPMLEQLEENIKNLRDTHLHLSRRIASLQREEYTSRMKMERLHESEVSISGELRLYGFDQPPEYFDQAEVLIKHLEDEYNSLKGGVNLLAERSYKEVYSGYRSLSLRKNQLEAERDSIVRFIESVEAEKTKVFMDAFGKLDRELRQTFTSLTGGSAWLEVENPSNPFSGGIFLMAQFQGRAPRESASLSGGEKTVSALAFILAMQALYASPFYILDEVDAHLDAINVERLASFIQERSQKCQIIALSLKDSLAARASLVYGLYVADGITRVVRYRPKLEVTVGAG